MSTMVKVSALKVGDVILDGIASRVDTIIPPDMTHGYTLCVTDGNGYSSQLRMDEGAEVLHFNDWTEEDWQAYLDM